MTQGDGSATEELLPVVYRELHRLARRGLASRPGHTLQPTALVHEAYLKLFAGEPVDWRDRDHFTLVATRAMRSILIDHARAKHTAKRAVPGERVPLEDLVASFDERAHGLLALDEALGRLARFDARMARIVELRFFGGVGMQDVARILSMSLRDVERKWRTARARLRRELA